MDSLENTRLSVLFAFYWLLLEPVICVISTSEPREFELPSKNQSVDILLTTLNNSYEQILLHLVFKLANGWSHVNTSLLLLETTRLSLTVMFKSTQSLCLLLSFYLLFLNCNMYGIIVNVTQLRHTYPISKKQNKISEYSKNSVTLQGGQIIT